MRNKLVQWPVKHFGLLLHGRLHYTSAVTLYLMRIWLTLLRRKQNSAPEVSFALTRLFSDWSIARFMKLANV